MTARNILKLSIEIIVIIIILFFLGRYVFSNWEKVSTYDWSFNPVPMVFSFLLFCLAYAFLPWIWRKILHYMGYKISYGDAWYIFYIGNIGRYIPGKVWTIAGMAYMAEKVGIPSSVAGISVVFANAYSLVSSFVFFILFLILRGTHSTSSGFFWLLPVFFIMTVVFIFPRNLERLVNVVLKKFGRNHVKIGVTTFTALKIVTLYILSGFLFGIAFWIFISAFVGWGLINPLFAASAYIIAYWVGFLAFFVPGGLGVREGILGLLFMSTIPAGILIIIATFSRLTVTIIEILFVVIALLRKGFLYGKEKPTEKK